MTGAIARRVTAARALWRLGLPSLWRVGLYRVLLRTGVYRRLLPIGRPIAGPFLDGLDAARGPSPPPRVDAAHWEKAAGHVARGELLAFSHQWRQAGFPPRWQRSLLTGVDADSASSHWSRLPDFGLAGGDVKGYWELARFDGLLQLVLGWLCSGCADFALAIEAWLASWCEGNPVNAGVQWKCGQETGIRLTQLLLAVELLRRWGGVSPRPALAQLVAQHAARIAPTMLYAIGQDNNHGTSEAAALFAAGVFLERQPLPDLARRGRRWKADGRRWLEERLARLVMPDGSFAQHSVNYHRMLLDTCAFAETVRRAAGEPPFSAPAIERCRAATAWLAAFTDPASGDAPNLGANDGARLFVLHALPYRDFRPSVQWASRLFCGAPVYPPGPWDEPSAWLDVGADGARAADTHAPARLWPDGGYARLDAGRAWAMVRLPRYRFRPSHADALHLDLWLDGRCRLCDGGTFSYAAEPRWTDYFSGTASHNTVQFDGRDQMPRVSRFLFGDWLEGEDVEVDAGRCRVSAAYRDRLGAWHRRTVQLTHDGCRVVDEISGIREAAVLRWRLAPTAGEWALRGGVCSDGTLRIRVDAGPSAGLARLECVAGWQSLHYGDKSALTVLEAEVLTDTTLTTEIAWPA